MKKKIIIALTVLCFIGLIVHFASWQFIAHLIKQNIQTAYETAELNDIKISGAFPEVTGYPGPHNIYFSGFVDTPEGLINVPSLNITSRFLPQDSLTVTMEKGVYMEGPRIDSELSKLDYLELTALIPARFPESDSDHDLQEWFKTDDAQLVIEDFKLTHNKTNITGSGVFQFDQNLQPEGTLNTTATGLLTFIIFLSQKKVIKPKEAIQIGAVIGGLSKTNPNSGEPYLEIPITVKSQTVFLGPIPVGRLPALRWGKRTPPAPLQ